MFGQHGVVIVGAPVQIITVTAVATLPTWCARNCSDPSGCQVARRNSGQHY